MLVDSFSLGPRDSEFLCSSSEDRLMNPLVNRPITMSNLFVVVSFSSCQIFGYSIWFEPRHASFFLAVCCPQLAFVDFSTCRHRSLPCSRIQSNQKTLADSPKPKPAFVELLCCLFHSSRTSLPAQGSSLSYPYPAVSLCSQSQPASKRGCKCPSRSPTWQCTLSTPPCIQV